MEMVGFSPHELRFLHIYSKIRATFTDSFWCEQQRSFIYVSSIAFVRSPKNA